MKLQPGHSFFLQNEIKERTAKILDKHGLEIRATTIEEIIKMLQPQPKPSTPMAKEMETTYDGTTIINPQKWKGIVPPNVLKANYESYSKRSWVHLC
jgi:hypothetical protein